MKAVRVVLVLLVLILVAVPFANATMNIYHFSNEVYSLGDVMLFSGDVTYTEDIRANLNIILICGESSEQVAVETLDLGANQPERFSSYVNLPVTLAGNCNVRLDLVNNGALLETSTFAGFELSDRLNATFEVSKDNYQLGEVFYLSGFVTKPNRSPVEGFAMIYFKQNGTTKFLGTGEVVRGSFSFSRELVRIPDGEYQITIFVTDNFGNKNTFENALVLNIESTLNVAANLQKSSYDPGDDVVVSGYVSNKLGTEVRDISLEFNFGAKTYNQKLASTSVPFTAVYHIPENVKTSSYAVEITAKDELGNYGYKNIVYNVNAIPTKLDLALQGTSFIPKENVGFSVSLVDQAGDPIADTVNVGLYDPDENLVLTKTVMTGTSDSVVLPEQAEPGAWSVKADGFGLSDEDTITVREYMAADVSLDGSELVINNLGNVPFRKDLGIEAGNLRETKDVKLKVGDSERIKLDKLFPDGTYQVRLPDFGKVFDGVNIGNGKENGNGLGGITGNVVKNLGNPGKRSIAFVLLAILGGTLIYLIYGRRRRKASDKWESSRDFSKDKDYLLGRKRLEELKAKGIRKDRPEYGKPTNQDIEYWKQRVQDAYKEQEQGKSNREFVERQQKSMEEDKPKQGWFNMFG